MAAEETEETPRRTRRTQPKGQARSGARARPAARDDASRDEIRALRELARVRGIELARRAAPGGGDPVLPEELVLVLRALGVPVSAPRDARAALEAERAAQDERLVEPVAAVE